MYVSPSQLYMMMSDEDKAFFREQFMDRQYPSITPNNMRVGDIIQLRTTLIHEPRTIVYIDEKVHWVRARIHLVSETPTVEIERGVIVMHDKSKFVLLDRRKI